MALSGSCSPCYPGFICPHGLHGLPKARRETEVVGMDPPITKVALSPQQVDPSVPERDQHVMPSARHH